MPKRFARCFSKTLFLDSTLNTDEAQHYKKPGKEFAAHEWVTHSSEEYARGETSTNTVEGFFSIFKRGMKGVYQHCKEKHLLLPCRIATSATATALRLVLKTKNALALRLRASSASG